MSALDPSRLQQLLAAMLLASVAVATFVVGRSPEWNLDGLFYAALMQPGARSVADAHRRVYAEVSSGVPRRAARALTDGSDNRRLLRASTERFAAQLPFYVTKPLYSWIGRALSAAGVRSVRAPYVVSAAAFAFLGLCLPLLAIAAGAQPTAALAAGMLAVWLPSMRELGALATPDALATMLFLAGAALSFSRIGLAAPMLALAILARADTAVLALAVLTAAALRRRAAESLRTIVPLAAGLSLLPFIVVAATGGYGWAAVVRHTFLEAVADGAGAQRGITTSEYFVALEHGLGGAMTKQTAAFLPYVALAAVSWSLQLKQGLTASQRTAAALLALVWAAALVRFLAVPILADRFFAPAYCCTIALAAALIAPAARPIAR